MGKFYSELVKNNLNIFDSVDVTWEDRTINGIITDIVFEKRLIINTEFTKIVFVPIYTVSTLAGAVKCEEKENESGTILLVYIEKI